MYVRINMPSLDLFNPLPALNKWFSKRDRHPKQNPKCKEQEWFVGVFKQAADDGTLQRLQINSDVTGEEEDDHDDAIAMNAHVEL